VALLLFVAGIAASDHAGVFSGSSDGATMEVGGAASELLLGRGRGSCQGRMEVLLGRKGSCFQVRLIGGLRRSFL
jgi:hypothetical protein